jgi:hypothetical protein
VVEVGLTDLINQQAWIRLHEARGVLELHCSQLTQALATAISVLPDETLKDRETLAAYLSEELTSVSRQLADAVDENWVAAWEKMMAGKFVDLPNIQN